MTGDSRGTSEGREHEIGPAGKTANKGCFHKQVTTVPSGTLGKPCGLRVLGVFIQLLPPRPLPVEACSWRCELPSAVVCPICEPGRLLWPKNALRALQFLEVGWPPVYWNAACHVNQQRVPWWTDSEMTPRSVPHRSIYTLM